MMKINHRMLQRQSTKLYVPATQKLPAQLVVVGKTVKFPAPEIVILN